MPYPLQFLILVMHDLLALSCMTALLWAARGYPFRSRRVGAAVFVLCGIVAAGNAALLLSGRVTARLDTDYLIYGAVSLPSVLLYPLLILRVKKPFTSALICLTVNAGMEGLFSVLGYLFENVDRLSYHIYESAFCALGYAAAAAFLVSVSKNRDLQIVRSTVDLIPRWLYGVILLCSFSSFFSVMGEDPSVYRFERVAGALRVFAVLGVLLFTGWFVLRVFILMARQNRILLQLQEQQLSYERMLHSDEQLRRYRHDSKNHMLVVTALLGAGKTQEATDYLQRIGDVSGVAQRRVVTGNLVVDAILNNKLPLAEKTGVTLEFSGVIPERGIDAADLCTVAGNLTDNALRAAAGAPENRRFVRVKAGVRGGFFTFSVTNGVAYPVEIKGNRVRTTKADAKNHGIGLRNVETAVKKYGGALLLSGDADTFTADASMKLNETEENGI